MVLIIEVIVCTILLIISAVVENSTSLLSPTSILIMFLAFLLFDTIIVYIRLLKIGSVSYRTDLDVARVLGNDVKEAYDFAKIGMAVIDDNNVVIWVNEFLFSRQVKILDLNIYDCFEELTQLSEQKDVVVKINNIAYEVRYIPDSNLFIFKDISAYTEEHENAVNESLVVGSLIIDTYDELQRTTESKKFNQMILNTVNDIDKYFGMFDCLVLPTANEDSYTILCSYSNFEKIQDDKFSLMDNIRNNLILVLL